MAAALHNMRQALCPNSTKVCELSNLQWQEILQGLHSQGQVEAPFRPPETENEVRFDTFGDSLGRYNIFHYHKEDGNYVYRKVGYWAQSLTLNTTLIPWASQVVPTSQCSDPCRKNEVKVCSLEMCAAGSVSPVSPTSICWMSSPVLSADLDSGL
ncbi:hypothetical protein F7725_017117 [Dissostichus mawsoni]|uniref:Uncharacterized protein n=1 Tax=Dissostichus mawsoni TaxID=36200 RepID=A0A7J5Z3Q1_DISMA|nr:hypothetical protein F7725_017117 [Dissostichus mawsoni]